MAEKPLVYICSGCGIGEAVKVDQLRALAEGELKAAGVKAHPFLCGPEGRQLLAGEVTQGRPVVIAACSPRVNADVFRWDGVTVERVNLRELVAWSQPGGSQAAQHLAEDYLRMGVARAEKTESPEPTPVATSERVLVVGGGISGLAAALGAADAGHDVLLVEKEPQLGGWVARWHRLLPQRAPYRDPQPSGIAELIARVTSHPRIEVLTAAEVEATAGQPGDFTVTVRRGEERSEYQVGAVVLATGWRPYDAGKLAHLGFGRSPDVVTSVAFEEMVRAGRIARPSDGRAPQRVAFIQCAGSRDPDHLPYCSSFCCAVSLKQALYVREQIPDAQAFIIYKDLRAPGPGELFYRRVQEDEGIFLAKGDVVGVHPGGDGQVVVELQDSLLGERVSLEVDLAVLAEQGYTPQSVPPAGQVVLIRRNANLSTGGTAIDVTDLVHPEVAARAVDAVRIIGLDIAGVDILAQDITRPMEEQGAVVVEVNAGPGLRMHVAPSVGVPRQVGRDIIDMMFPPGDDGRIPIAAVTGVNGKTTVTRFIAHILRGTGRRVGMTCTDGIYLDERRIEKGDCSGPQSARMVLMNPTVEMAVFETARGGILREGLGFDQCDVAVVTNIGDGDHLGLADVHTPEQLAVVKRVVVEAVSPKGVAVLNAADPLVAAMAMYCPGQVALFAIDGNHPEIQRHRKAGGKAALVRDGQIILAEGEHEQVVTTLSRVPLTFGGRVAFEVENSLAAIAAAVYMGVPLEIVRARAESFTPDMSKVPARFNLFQINGATVIVDYGHNASSLRAMIAALDGFPHQRRTCVYTTAGDRRDCDIICQGEILGNAFDRVILYEDHYLRGRKQGEIIAFFRQGLARGNRVKQVEEVYGADNAVATALNSVGSGELLLAQADTVDETVDFIRKYLADLNQPEGPTDNLSQVVPARVDSAAPAKAPAALAAASVAART